MKPFVIYAEKNLVDVTMTKAEFEKYIKEAYEGGYEDGYKAGKASIKWDWPTNITTKDYPINTPVYYGTGSGTPVGINPNPYKVTCEAHNSVE